MFLTLVGGFLVVSLLWAGIRYALALIVIYLVFSGFSGSYTPGDSSSAPTAHILTYQELVKYPTSCDRADEQLAELKQLQQIKNFAQDPDSLSEQDRAYNGRLKATIWWYSYECNK
jgi:hypothetical protein